MEVAPNLIGVKFTFAGSNFGSLQEAMILTPNLSYFVGESLLVSAMQIGARGSYSSVVCVNPDFMKKMFDLAESGDWNEAVKMQRMIAKFFIEFGELMDQLGEGDIDPVGDKGLAVASGFFVGHQRTRPPYIGWSDEGLTKVRSWLESKYPEFIWKA